MFDADNFIPKSQFLSMQVSIHSLLFIFSYFSYFDQFKCILLLKFYLNVIKKECPHSDKEATFKHI